MTRAREEEEEEEEEFIKFGDTTSDAVLQGNGPGHRPYPAL